MAMATAATIGQLAICQYQKYPASGLPCCSHLVISSSAPLEAEQKFHSGLLPDRSKEFYDQLKQDISSYLQRFKSNDDPPVIRLVIRIHGFNVPLTDVLNLDFREASHKLAGDCTVMDTANDFVLFVHYCWPSERMFSGGPLAWIAALPALPKLLLGAAGAAGLLMWIAGKPLLVPVALLMMLLTLIFLRAVVYFRDRDRAASFGVFDGVETIRALHHLLQELLKENLGEDAVSRIGPNPFPLSFIAHSMGSFVTTQLVRVLTNVFDPDAGLHYWGGRPYGPFEAADASPPSADCQSAAPAANRQSHPLVARIGELFVLHHLVLASPDIPIWAITSGRSNYLASCLRRFRHTYLLVNDADIILRFASSLANYFVFPSRTPIGGYRLGNLSIKQRGTALAGELRGGYGFVQDADSRSLVVHGISGSRSLTQRPFDYDPARAYAASLLDCTDYQDSRCEAGTAVSSRVQRRLLSAFTANNRLLRCLNYAATAILQAVGRIDSHVGYFRGKTCLDLIYNLALYDCPKQHNHNGSIEHLDDQLQKQLQKVGIAWLDLHAAADRHPSQSRGLT